MLREVLKIAQLAETTAEFSALADVLIEDALRESESRMQQRYGIPQRLDAEGRAVHTPFAVLSLGKLGGNELNYSSDVDLMYVFGDGEAPADAAISNREYFIRLAQQVTEVLSSVTREGPVFRIDMRLRPQGAEGELAISLDHALRYYSETAHDWERQALIKVRYSAGDETLAREFIRKVQPHVYTTQVNFPAIETALQAREKMHIRRRRLGAHQHEQTIDVKVDRGGIRDIEFLVQCLQRVYGGAEPWLRSGGTLFSLQKLHDKGHISGNEFHELTNAYDVLLHLEHRLQLRQGLQPQELRASQSKLRILERSMEGYASGQDRVVDVTFAVGRRMEAVAGIYNRIIHHQQIRRSHEAPDTEFELRSTAEPGAAEHSNDHILERLADDSAQLYEIASRRDLSTQARRNLFRFFSSAFTSSERYAGVMRYPQALERALELFVSDDKQDAPALTKAAEQMMQALGAYTRDGMVFPVDARLRPRGGEGELLVTLSQLETYFAQEAQPWEALMYSKLRFLAGSRPLADSAAVATTGLFQRFAGDSDFLPAIREMRTKLQNAEPGEKNFKTSAGAIYDIDFLASYLLIKHEVKEKHGTLRDRLWRCVAAGLLEKSDAATLDHGAELLRTAEHVVRLVVGRARKWLPATEHAKQVTEDLTSRILSTKWSEGLEAELTRTCGEVRSLYSRLIG